MPKFQTLPEVLQHWAQEKPESPAFIFRDKNQQRRVLTWASVYTLSGRFAAVLRDQGIARGDLVINSLPNSPERVVCETGIWMAGAASVNAQCLMTDGSDLLHTVSLSRAPAILVDPDVTNSPWNVLKNHVVLEDGDQVTSSSLPSLKKVIFVRRVDNDMTGDFIGQLKTREEWFCAKDVTPEDVFTVLTTSGSTGFSKLVIQKQGSYIEYAQHRQGAMTAGIMLNATPMGWMGGCLLFSIVHGTTRVACDMRAGTPEDNPRYLWACIQEEKCTIAHIHPSYLPEIAKIAKSEQLKSDTEQSSKPVKLRAVMLGGHPIQKHLVAAGLVISHTVINMFGSCEFGFACAIKVVDSETFTDHDTGRPFPGVEIKVVTDQDESKPCACGENGHILVKSPNMLKAYLNSPKVTADAFTEDGFFRTGDLGRLDERGHLIVDGRGSDAIMRGTYIFYPSWIENSLRKCPGVSDVVVVGVPHALLVNELCACVVLESDDVSLDQVRKFAEGAFMSKDDGMSGCPRHYITFESIPLMTTGKPHRKLVKSEATLRLDLQSVM